MFNELMTCADVRTARVSTWDHRGHNHDFWITDGHDSAVIADLEGPGRITHIWMTQSSHTVLGPDWEEIDPDYYRKILLKITWDDESEPAVLVPLGDFFGVGHSLPNSYASALFSVSVTPEESGLVFGGSAGLNCWAPMPFQKRALIELVNESDLPLKHYFYIDYELTREPLSEDTAYFHSRWTRQEPGEGWAPDLKINSPGVDVPNLTGEDNFVILDTVGRGHYVGCNLSVYHRQGTWWNEGDDMIFIDNDTWPPSLHGSGSEDYFGHAYGMQKNAFPYHGSIVHRSEMPGYSVVYRLHVVDPVHFAEKIKVSMEHGHANHLSDDWAATAYWYQTLPSPPASILPVAERLPTRWRPERFPTPVPSGDVSAETIDGLRGAAAERRQQYLDQREEQTRASVELSRAAAEANRIRAAEVRESFR